MTLMCGSSHVTADTLICTRKIPIVLCLSHHRFLPPLCLTLPAYSQNKVQGEKAKHRGRTGDQGVGADDQKERSPILLLFIPSPCAVGLPGPHLPPHHHLRSVRRRSREDGHFQRLHHQHEHRQRVSVRLIRCDQMISIRSDLFRFKHHLI